jgi:hypothetical protein
VGQLKGGGGVFGCWGGGDSQIKAHETIPHSPPATSTASGFEWVPSPPNVVKSCLLLSYVMKYVAVPSVSRTGGSGSVSCRNSH